MRPIYLFFLVGKELICDPEVPPVDLKELCCSLRLSHAKDTLANPKKKSKQCNGTGLSINSELSSGTKLEDNSSTDSNESWPFVSDCVYDLLKLCLDLNPDTRITAHQALAHSFFTTMNNYL